jgi:hypothetical protein
VEISIEVEAEVGHTRWRWRRVDFEVKTHHDCKRHQRITSVAAVRSSSMVNHRSN